MKRKLGLVPKLIIAIILGILIGQYAPLGLCSLIVTLSGIFSNFLKFVIPLMILAYVSMGIADLSQGAGKLLLFTVILAYGSTLIGGTISYLVSINLFPSFIQKSPSRDFYPGIFIKNIQVKYLFFVYYILYILLC